MRRPPSSSATMAAAVFAFQGRSVQPVRCDGPVRVGTVASSCAAMAGKLRRRCLDRDGSREAPEDQEVTPISGPLRCPALRQARRRQGYPQPRRQDRTASPGERRWGHADDLKGAARTRSVRPRRAGRPKTGCATAGGSGRRPRLAPRRPHESKHGRSPRRRRAWRSRRHRPHRRQAFQSCAWCRPAAGPWKRRTGRRKKSAWYAGGGSPSRISTLASDGHRKA